MKYALNQPARTRLYGFILASLLLIFSTLSFATEFVVSYNDEEGVGFNDTTTVDPLATNPGTTQGEQRRFAFDWALEVIAKQIHSPFPITIGVTHAELGDFCAQAFSVPVVVETLAQSNDQYGGLLLPETVYTQAQEAALTYEFQGVAFEDIESLPPMIGIRLGLSCPDSYETTASDTRTFAQTVMHEVIHGLGFGSQVITHDQSGDFGVMEDEEGRLFVILPEGFLLDDGTFSDGTGRSYLNESGDYLNDHPGILDRQFVVANEDGSATALNNLSNAQRFEAADTGVSYQGSSKSQDTALNELTAGVSAQGQVEMHVNGGGEQDGQALNHYAADVFPAQMMASAGAATYDWGMAAFALEDMGWGCHSDFSVNASESEGRFDVLIDNPSDCTFSNISFEAEIPAGIALSDIDATPGSCAESSGTLTCEFSSIGANDNLRILFSTSEQTATSEGETSDYLFKMEIDVDDFHVDRMGLNNFAELTMTIGTEPPVVTNPPSDPGCVAMSGPVLFSQAYASSGVTGSGNLGFLLMPFLLGAIRLIRRSKRLPTALKIILLAMLGIGLMACGGGSGSSTGCP